MNHINRLLIYFLAGCCLTLAASCEGVFDGIYDEGAGSDTEVKPGQLYIDATSWNDWYYIDLDSLVDLIDKGDAAALQQAQTKFTPWPIPQTENADAARDSSGMYIYWFDIFGKGMSNYERRGYKPTAPCTATTCAPMAAVPTRQLTTRWMRCPTLHRPLPARHLRPTHGRSATCG